VIRPATPEDMPELLRMGRAFFAATAFGEIGFEEDEARATLTLLAERGILLVAEQNGLCGMAGALVFPFYFNLSHLTAQELFWWVDPRARQSGQGAELLAALEAAARARGAKSLTMIALDEIDGPRVAELYRRNGYAPSERNFIKVF